MKKIVRTMLDWDIYQYHSKMTTPLMSGLRPRINVFTITLEGNIGRLVLGLEEDIYGWRSTDYDAMKELLARVPEFAIEKEECRGRNKRYYELVLKFERIRGEEFTITAMKLATALLRAILQPQRFPYIPPPTVQQETLIRFAGTLVPFGDYLARQFYPKEWTREDKTD